MTDTHLAAGGRRDADAHGAPADRAHIVFAGLAPRHPAAATSASRPTGLRTRTALSSTVPLVLTGAIALGLGVAGPVDAAPARKPSPPQPGQSPAPGGLRAMLSQWGAAITPGAQSLDAVANSAAPASYLVQPGDTVSDVAARFGLPTAVVLARNGLSWKSTIFPGQVLSLGADGVKRAGRPAVLADDGLYAIARGDTLSSVAQRFGISVRSILERNGLNPASIIYPGQKIVIPGHSPRDAEPQLALAQEEGEAVPELTLASVESSTAAESVATLAAAPDVSTLEIAAAPRAAAAASPRSRARCVATH